MYRYLLMNKAESAESGRESGVDCVDRFIKRKELRAMDGYMLGKRLRERIQREVDEVREENKKIKEDVLAYQSVQKILDAMGFTINELHWYADRRIADRLEEMKAGLSKGFLKDVEQLRDRCTEIVSLVEKGDS